MTTLGTLIAIAAWCGFPSAGGQTFDSVAQCRQAIYQCIQTKGHKAECFTQYDLVTGYQK